jgi:hypothetical protein
MTNVFDQFDDQPPTERKPGNVFDQFDEDKSYSSAVLPFSRDASGSVHFDPNAGILGSLIRSFTLPHDVMAGEVSLPSSANPSEGQATYEPNFIGRLLGSGNFEAPSAASGIGRALEMGATISPVNPAVQAGDRAIAGAANALRKAKVKPPTAEALSAAGSAGYDAARDMGVHYSSDAVAKVADALRRNLEADGILDELAPKTHSILNRLSSPPEGSTVPLSGLEAARRSLGYAGRDFTNPTEQEASRRVVGGFDEFVASPDPSAVVAGPAAAAGETLAAARGNYAASQRSARLHGVEEAADIRAAAANSGQNLDNAIRSRVASVLLDPRKRAGYSAEELAALEEVAKGTAPRELLRYVGNLLGGGGGLGAAVAGGGAGFLAGSPGIGAAVGVGAPAVGFAAKRIANILTRRALREADASVRRRSPLYSEMQKNAPLSIPSPEARAAVARALMLIGGNEGGNQ